MYITKKINDLKISINGCKMINIFEKKNSKMF